MQRDDLRHRILASWLLITVSPVAARVDRLRIKGTESSERTYDMPRLS